MNPPSPDRRRAGRLPRRKQPAARSRRTLRRAPTCASMVARDRRARRGAGRAAPFSMRGRSSADRVMARVAVAERRRRRSRLPATPRALAARRRAVGAALLVSGGIVAGFIWAGGPSGRGAAMVGSGAARRRAQPLAVAAGDGGQRHRAAVVRVGARYVGDSGPRACWRWPVSRGRMPSASLGLRRLMTEPATHAGW